MKKQLQKQSFRAILVLSIVLLAAGVFALYLSGFGVFALIGGGKVADELPIDQLKGKYVTYTVDFIYDRYAYTTETSKTKPKPVTVSSEYIIPLGYGDGGYYMGLYAPKKDLARLNKLMKESQTYLDGGAAPTDSYTITGTILPMDEESLKFFHESVGYNEEDSDAEYQAMFLPYYLKIGFLGKQEYYFTLFLTAASAAAIFCALLMLLRAVSGGYQGDIRKYCKASGDEAHTLEQLENWYETTEAINGLRMGSRWTMFNEGAYTRLLDTNSIAWAYLRTVEHRRNGIKTGTNYSMVVRTTAGKKLELHMSSTEQVYQALAHIEQNFPNIVLGYQDSWERLYKQNPSGFAQTILAAAQAAAQTAEQPTEN